MLFKYNSQQWFNTDCIEHVTDTGSHFIVKLKGGQFCTVDDREGFLAVIEQKPAVSNAPPVGWPHGVLYAG